MKNTNLLIILIFISTHLFGISNLPINDDTTRIKTKHKTYLIIDNGEDDFSFEEDTTETEEDDVVELVGMFEVGMAGYLTPSNKMALPVSQQNMELDYSKSYSWSYNFMLGGANIIKDRVYISPGIGISTTGYAFKNNISISTGSDTTAFLLDSSIVNDKYKLKATYLQVPLVLGFRIGNTSKKPFGIQIGAIGGYKIGSRVKQKYYLSDSQTKQKNKIKDDYNLNPFKVDLLARISVGNFGIYGKYALTALFENNKAPGLIPFSIGFTFGGF